ncbi:helix-turn-helix domain-containing protein [Iodobacter fluviatilis]|uniref:Helix-turn-helix domain n=1 Tax=Iodobacter fluviatilis TaxID=537 RepID=A0A377Q8Y8_9NEIS|nr:helix-turn-helix transcriptional regulator [Iodobacter fluviatilis]TCU88556.1 hypothetical protein EV682_103140 [Iodobacter fluviatilis]STQ91373.1 Helix-turn-helix domain [Iodobacter fluviatilis]
MDIFNSIGDRLRAERELMGLSQTEFAAIAARAGVPGATRQSQSLYEKGKRQPDAGYLAAIAHAGADIAYILTGEREHPAPQRLSAEEQTLLNEFRAMDEKTRKRILAFALSGETPASSKFAVAGHVGQQIESVSGGDFRIDMTTSRNEK